MTLYSDSKHPVRNALSAVHQQTLESFTTPGRWFNAAERAQIVGEARSARVDAGVQEPLDEQPRYAELPSAVADLARRAQSVGRKADTTTKNIGIQRPSDNANNFYILTIRKARV